MDTPIPDRHEATPLTLEEERLSGELLDTVPPPACEGVLGRDDAGAITRCGEAASWGLALSCGATIYYCDRHHVRLHAWLDDSPTFCNGKHDPAIGATHPPTEIDYEWKSLS